MKKTLLTVTGLCISTSAFSGGYRVALQGQQALGMGHTGVAMSESAEVVFFNPAAMSFLESDSNITAGITLISGDTEYQNQQTNTSAKTDNPIGTPVGLYYTKKYDDKFHFGLGLYTPYGNTVEWPTDWAGSHLVNNIELKAIYIQPTVSYKINDKYSVGLGLSYISGDVEFNRNLNTSTVDANGDRSNVTVKAEGVSDWNFNLGFLAKPTDELSVGVSYRSEATMEARNEPATFSNIPGSLQSTFTSPTTFNADLVLPAEITVGVAYDLDSKTILAFDITRTQWSAYESLDIDFGNGQSSINARNYSDSNVYRFGAQHALNDAIVLRGGIYFDKTPVEAGYFAPETPRNDSIGLTAGGSYAVNKQLDLDFSLLVLMFEEFNGSYDHIINSDGSTSSFGGDYLSSVITLGFGVNYKF
ncbi:MAG: transporter [endosymbiont of Galathealinum brachiosum]|uniref:Transporter n=1 Tax=endosymbiont of Galathealinum brachiosum TaxID=2200906 RepID=A0A370DDZ1_9GAMM|nr:MAG: transporter [endosymbiont of Galathealinum brachiosum]